MWLANLNVRRDACVEKRAGDRGPRGVSGGRQGGADVADRAARRSRAAVPQTRPLPRPERVQGARRRRFPGTSSLNIRRDLHW